MAKQKLIVDQELADWLPSISPEEIQDLRHNLERDGCRDPIVRWKETGKIIDGHNRYDLCQEMGIEYAVVDRSFPDVAAVKRWMFDNQAGRRNWTESQRGLAAAKLDHLDSQSNKSKSPVPEEQKNQTEKAAKFSVSRPTFARGVAVVEKGTPELITAVEDGEVELKAAVKIAKLPRKKQPAAVKKHVATQNGNGQHVEIKDELGNKIPDDLCETFDARRHLDDALNHLTAISKLLNPYLGDARENVKPAAGGEHLPRQRIEAALTELRSCIRFAKPYALCPDHSGPKCLRCGGKRWVTKEAFERCGVK